MALFVVTGPPAAGKTTWVDARAQEGDIVVDMDRLAQALTAPGADYHRYSRAIRTVAQKARYAAIQEALRVSDRVDVYVIDTQPGEDALRTYQARGAEVVVVDPGRDVVMARCEEQRSTSTRSAVDRWYATHGDCHEQSQSRSRVW